MPYEDFLEVSAPVTRTQQWKARKDGHREPDKRKRLEDVFTKLDISNSINLAYIAWRHYLEIWSERTAHAFI